VRSLPPGKQGPLRNDFRDVEPQKPQMAVINLSRGRQEKSEVRGFQRRVH
jgi:hypothetical protein